MFGGLGTGLVNIETLGTGKRKNLEDDDPLALQTLNTSAPSFPPESQAQASPEFLVASQSVEWIKCSGKLPGEEVRGIERSRLRIVKLGLRREKAHGDTIERPYGSTGVRMINSI